MRMHEVRGHLGDVFRLAHAADRGSASYVNGVELFADDGASLTQEDQTMSMNVIDHIELPVANVEASRRFYEAALRPLDLSLVVSVDPARTARGGARYGFGQDGYPSLWIHGEDGPRLPVHIAFTASDHGAVSAFYAEALDTGGTDNGMPGIRERYHPRYYAAYILDPDGNNIETVCQGG